MTFLLDVDTTIVIDGASNLEFNVPSKSFSGTVTLNAGDITFEQPITLGSGSISSIIDTTSKLNINAAQIFPSGFSVTLRNQFTLDQQQALTVGSFMLTGGTWNGDTTAATTISSIGSVYGDALRYTATQNSPLTIQGRLELEGTSTWNQVAPVTLNGGTLNVTESSTFTSAIMNTPIIEPDQGIITLSGASFSSPIDVTVQSGANITIN